jgi:hypothetical protein
MLRARRNQRASAFRLYSARFDPVLSQNATAQRCSVAYRDALAHSRPTYRSESTPMRLAAAQSNSTLSESLTPSWRNRYSVHDDSILARGLC